ncbi:hypothetical protein [Trueperella bialowiezensis]|uniref:YCII-related domain-containing protein n=1 Tax=Trueperella bialowiezensis TaxID=312285 RepID=A0A448PFY6_9ACTO|nr:hypothetical protein [Trueperella bialowiezensis]VEI13804.1 Uncharacterised protein [Trueperella bialowiezensis]
MNSNRYLMDYDWLWDKPPRNDGSLATVRLTVSGSNARDAVDAWLAQLPADENGIRGRGGWVLTEVPSGNDAETVVLDITSGGEDVADGIYWGTEEAYEALNPAGVTLEWENLPRKKTRRRG